jgi:hypothetical protein
VPGIAHVAAQPLDLVTGFAVVVGRQVVPVKSAFSVGSIGGRDRPIQTIRTSSNGVPSCRGVHLGVSEPGGVVLDIQAPR